DSFSNVKQWLEEIDRYACDNGTNCSWAISAIDHKKLSITYSNLGIPFLETSAKNSTNVEQAFMTMAAEIKARVGPPSAARRRAPPSRSSRDGPLTPA
ncbi:hypothetical protein MSG28_007090, partial [Choristoneura fumiferana]